MLAVMLAQDHILWGIIRNFLVPIGEHGILRMLAMSAERKTRGINSHLIGTEPWPSNELERDREKAAAKKRPVI